VTYTLYRPGFQVLVWQGRIKIKWGPGRKNFLQQKFCIFRKNEMSQKLTFLLEKVRCKYKGGNSKLIFLF